MNQNDSTVDLVNVVDFLTSLGYNNFCFIVYQFVMPIISLIGLILITFSIWIFFTRKEFQIKMYDYYRCLVVVYWTHLALAVPYAFFFTPRYLPYINTLPWAALQSFYFTYSNFACHLAGIVEIGIILDRERNFSPLVKRYYTLEPRMNCLIFFLVAVVVNIVCAFDFVPGVSGMYYYIDGKTGEKLVNTYYWPVFTDFAASKVGYVSTVTVYVVRDLLTLIVGIVLNVISTVHLNNYYEKKRLSKILPSQARANMSNEQNTTSMTGANNNNSLAHMSATITKTPVTSVVSEEKNKSLEIKLLVMVVVLCLISTIERTFLLACNIYGATGLMNDLSLLLGTLVDLTLAVGPAIAFFVFYFFNNHFQNVVLEILFKRKQ